VGGGAFDHLGQADLRPEPADGLDRVHAHTAVPVFLPVGSGSPAGDKIDRPPVEIDAVDEVFLSLGRHFAIPLFTNVQLARRFVEAISRKSLADLQIKSWKEYR
jgi:hypothetical protein